jgi:hypothetical protein
MSVNNSQQASVSGSSKEVVAQQTLMMTSKAVSRTPQILAKS